MNAERNNINFLVDNQAFGIASASALPAKEVIFPITEDQNSGAEDVYRRSHGAIGPGEQITRGYDWHGVDMSKKVFGMKGNSLAYNGVSINVAEALKDGCSSDQASTITLKRVSLLLSNISPNMLPSLCNSASFAATFAV